MQDYQEPFQHKVIDLTVNSFRTYGDLYVNHTSLSGTGRITASENIRMSIAGDDELVQAFIMSENGEIDIDAADLDYNGIIYAPNGKVKINAKDINFTGAIYADSIEINGTSLNVGYRNFFFLNCHTHTSDTVYVHKNENLVLNGSVLNSADSIVYNADGSATLLWDYSTFEIDQIENIGIFLETGFLNSTGYEQITTDTKLVSYDSNGIGSVIYLDDIIVGKSDNAEQGKWTSSVFDSKVENCQWSYVKWNADYYGNSAMDVYLSTSNDGVSFSERQRVANGEEIQLSGRYIRTEIEIKASDDGASPVLYDLTVYSDEFEISDMKQGADVSIKGAHSVPAGSPVTLWLDIDGKYSFKAVGKDNDGYESETIFEIQIAGTYESEIQTEEMQEALEQTSETMLNDELKILAQSFSSPTDAYEYVYNNIHFESYINSRRGAIGAYELKRGNDFDQASLLIGLLREMGYPAVYANGTAIISCQQAAELMALDDFDYASLMISSSGRDANILHFEDGTSYVKMDEVFVRVYVPASETGETAEKLKDLGVWANLDTSIKSSTLNASEMHPAEEKEVDMTEALIQSEGTQTGNIIASMKKLAPAITEKTGDASFEEMFEGPATITKEAEYVYSRDIVQQSFNRLPVDLQYDLFDSSIDIYNAIPTQLSDTVQFVVSNGVSGKNLGTFKISEIYNKRMTLGFKEDTGSGTIFDMSKNNIYYNAFLPAIYVDGEVVSEYSYNEYSRFLDDYMIEPEDEYYFFKNNLWRLGEKCSLTTKIITNGRESIWTDDLTIGSTYAMVYDTGGVTESQYYGSLYGAAEANGIDVSDPSDLKEAETSEEIINSLNYYDEDKIGSYLAFAGTYYFMNCDTYGYLDAGFSNIELGYDTKMLLTSYRVGSYEDTITGNTTSIIPGRFEIDVNYNNNYRTSRSDDTEARNKHLFSTSYIESYFEGWIWEQLLFSKCKLRNNVGSQRPFSCKRMRTCCCIRRRNGSL